MQNVKESHCVYFHAKWLGNGNRSRLSVLFVRRLVLCLKLIDCDMYCKRGRCSLFCTKAHKSTEE